MKMPHFLYCFIRAVKYLFKFSVAAFQTVFEKNTILWDITAGILLNVTDVSGERNTSLLTVG
jgi:hypothetical protein